MITSGTKYCFNVGIIFAFLVLSCLRICATSYYVSNSGSDSNSGLSATHAWKTLNKINRTFFKPGDHILFNRGDKWNGTINVKFSGKNGNPIVFGAYGSGNNPVISGLKTITGWYDEGRGVYSKTIEGKSGVLNMVVVNGINTSMGRWPNAGIWNSYENHEDYFSITDHQLTDTPDWDDAEAVVRFSKWALRKNKITDHTSTDLIWTADNAWSQTNGFGYFIQNHIATLDQLGEWYYRNGKLFMYFGTVDPTSKEVKIAITENLMRIDKKHFITVQNLDFEGANTYAIHNTSGSFNIVQNCSFINIGAKAIFIDSNSTDASMFIKNNIFRNINNNAIHLLGSDTYTEIKDNIISDIGIFPGMGGKVDDNFGDGISLHGTNSIIEYNYLSNIGHSGIAIRKNPGITVRYNYIENFGLTRYDAGGIYTWENKSAIINNNIINGSNHSSAGVNGSSDLALNGIYVDNDCSNIIVLENTIINCNSKGLYILNADSTTFLNNTAFNNGIQLGMTFAFGYGNAITGMKIKHNKLISKTIEQVVLRYRNDTSPLNQFGISDSNNYVVLNDNDYPIQTQVKQYLTNSTLSEWKKITGQDINSTFNVLKLLKEEEKLFYNNTKQRKKFYLGKSVFRELSGSIVKDSFHLEPFTSRVLIGKDFELINQKPEISGQSFHFSSPKLPQYSIGQIFASDPDEGQILKFSVVDGNEMGLFAVDSLSGQVFTVNEINTSRDLIIELTVRVSDNSPNLLSDNAKIIIKIDGTDLSPPAITSFSIPSRAFSYTIPIERLQASDDLGINGYLLSEQFMIPDLKNPDWKPVAPSHYSFSQEGTKTLYAWTKDSAGNISSPAVDTIVITLPDLSPKYSEFLFEESSGISVYDSRDENHGIIVNYVLREEGVIDNGIRFSGSGYVNFGQCYGENVLNEVTLSIWLKPNLTNRSTQGIIIHGGPNTTTYGLYITQDSASIGFITKGTTNEEIFINNINELWDGNWHHITAIYNGSEKRICMDGKLLTSVVATGQMEVGYGYNLLAGAGSDEINPTFLYHGSLDEVRIYNYALDQTETENLYHSVNKIMKKTFTEEHVSICEGQDYLGWKVQGEYKRTLKRIDPVASGADSIVTTFLDIWPVYEVSELATIKEGENYQGWTESGAYQRQLVAIYGCDSLITTNLTVIPPVFTTEEVFVCEGESFMGHTSQGQYQRKYNSSSGADSIVITNLFVNPKHYTIKEVTISEGEDYNGWTETGTYFQKLNSVYLCDSIEEIHLKVVQPEIQFVDLEKGWNLFSTYLVPSQLNMENVFEKLNQQVNLVEVQDENGNIYRQEDGILINLIGNLRESDGYKIRVDYPCVLQITGNPVKLPMNIQLYEGWNIISFPFNGSTDALEVIYPLIKAGILEKVQDEKGHSIEYWGSHAGWVNGIGNFNAGEGYLIQVNKDGILPISVEYDKSGMKLSGILKPVYFKPVYFGNGYSHMNINLTGLNKLNLKAGDEIAAFDGNKCVGAVKLNDFNVVNNLISISASASFEDFLDGFNERNNIELRIWQTDLNAEFVLQTELINGKMKYENRRSVFAQLSGKVKLDSKIDIRIFPNPAYNKVMIYFSHEPESDTKIIIADFLGKPVLTKAVKSKFESVDINYLSSGTYLVKILSGDKSITSKSIVII